MVQLHRSILFYPSTFKEDIVTLGAWIMGSESSLCTYVLSSCN